MYADGSCGSYSEVIVPNDPTCGYTIAPTPSPTTAPTTSPTPNPTPAPTTEPTPNPTPAPTTEPTPNPTPAPTTEPTPNPTPNPTPSPVAPTCYTWYNYSGINQNIDFVDCGGTSQNYYFVYNNGSVCALAMYSDTMTQSTSCTI